MNETRPLNTPCVIYHWKEERKRNLECHLRISVSLRCLELWGGFGNPPEFSKINAQLFVSGVPLSLVVSLYWGDQFLMQQVFAIRLLQKSLNSSNVIVVSMYDTFCERMKNYNGGPANHISSQSKLQQITARHFEIQFSSMQKVTQELLGDSLFRKGAEFSNHIKTPQNSCSQRFYTN